MGHCEDMKGRKAKHRGRRAGAGRKPGVPKIELRIHARLEVAADFLDMCDGNDKGETLAALILIAKWASR